MTEQAKIVFEDGAAYEKMMGVWSRSVGEVFLDWIKPEPGLRWLDVGCGNGAFSQLIMDRAGASQLCGVDPSEAQISYARERLRNRPADIKLGSALDLPFEDNAFDAAVMALVIFFVPDPKRALSEMTRVTRPGGLVAAYAWDIPGEGLPHSALHHEIERFGVKAPLPPSWQVSSLAALANLWAESGLTDIETRAIPAERRFASFDEFWTINCHGPMSRVMAQLTPEAVEGVKEGLRSKFTPEASGEIVCRARANAIKGRLPL